LQQELTDFADVRIGMAINRQRRETACVLVNVGLRCTFFVMAAMVARAVNDREAEVMLVPCFGHQLVQPFAEQSDAGVSCQQ